MKIKKPVILIIMDGFGIREDTDYNAVAQANTPNLDSLFSDYPYCKLKASGVDVGLPKGQMGNSEVGHMNLGAGRIVYQDYTRVNKAISDGSFFKNRTMIEFFEKVNGAGGAIHILGLLSDGGVHSHMEHIYAAIRSAKGNGVKDLYIHAFMDGRDTPPTSGVKYMEELMAFLTGLGYGKVATLGGRYYGMDRDNRWERVKKAYDAIVLGEGEMARDPLLTIEDAYSKGELDEFIMPTVIVGDEGPVGKIRDGDGLFFINFRADRGRELTRAFSHGSDPSNFREFERGYVPKLSGLITMTQYDEEFDLPEAFIPLTLEGILGELISEAGKGQLRIAETEKYAHVTFFFSGGREEKFPGEERLLIQSPKDVPTYDLKPEMSAYEITDSVISRIEGGKYALIVLNFANPDMVGHTGVMEAAVRAVEVVDECVGRVSDVARANGYSVLITADHGNVEEMWDYKNDEPHTAHTTNPVPFILVDDDYRGRETRGGILADVAPTILDIMGIERHEEMTGSSLIL